MKRRILVIEDNIYKTACMKNCAEAQFHLEVGLSESSGGNHLIETVLGWDADEIFFAPESDIESFFRLLRQLKVTRLQTELHILVCPDFDASGSRLIKQAVHDIAAQPKCVRRKLKKGLKRDKPTGGIGLVA